MRRPRRCGANEKKSRPANDPSATRRNSSAASSELMSRMRSRKVGPHSTSPDTAIDAPSQASTVISTLWR